MKLLLLDYEHGYEPADLATFSSDRSCFDYDVIIWDPGNAVRGYNTGCPSQYRGLPSLDEASSVRSISDIARRRSEFREFVNSGRVLFVIVRPPQRFVYDTGRRTYLIRARDVTRRLPSISMKTISGMLYL